MRLKSSRRPNPGRRLSLPAKIQTFCQKSQTPAKIHLRRPQRHSPAPSLPSSTSLPTKYHPGQTAHQTPPGTPGRTRRYPEALSGAGPQGRWRRSHPLWAQVHRVLGAGVEKVVGPAPLERVKPRFAAQVPYQKSHLRQEYPTPAPESGTSCAKDGLHLRHQAYRGATHRPCQKRDGASLLCGRLRQGPCRSSEPTVRWRYGNNGKYTARGGLSFPEAGPGYRS